MSEISDLKTWMEKKFQEVDTKIDNLGDKVSNDFASLAVLKSENVRLNKDIENLASKHREDVKSLHTKIDEHQEEDNAKFTALWVKVAGISAALAAGGFVLGGM